MVSFHLIARTSWFSVSAQLLFLNALIIWGFPPTVPRHTRLRRIQATSAHNCEYVPLSVWPPCDKLLSCAGCPSAFCLMHAEAPSPSMILSSRSYWCPANVFSQFVIPSVFKSISVIHTNRYEACRAWTLCLWYHTVFWPWTHQPPLVQWWGNTTLKDTHMGRWAEARINSTQLFLAIASPPTEDNKG